ncbi:MAG: polysaccharide biosynthesis protein [Heyndrickxia sp.]
MLYSQRVLLLIMIDSLIVLSAIFLSRILVHANFHEITFPLILSSITLFIGHHFFFFIYKLYKKAWEYASIGELLIIFKAVTYSIFVAVFLQLFVLHEVFWRVLAVTWMLHMLFIGGSRFLWRVFRDSYFKKSNNMKRTLIIGAGSAGTMITRQLLTNTDKGLLPVAFIDDSIKKQNLDIMGLPVLGGIDQIERAVQGYRINHIIIAIPSLSKKELNKIFEACSKTNIKTQILPMLEDIVTGKISVNHFRDVQVEDLLGREPVELDIDSISEYITNKVVLVTGAGGSIGSEICRQISKFNPDKLILLGHGENSIYSIEMELKSSFRHSQIEFITEIADIQDAKKISAIIQTHQPHVVYHAAAHKHVPLMERNPEEAVKNNVIGTWNIADAASWHGVETFVMISSDKAVNPTSVMGATKRLAEMIIQYMDKKSKTKFVAVRFGNVLGSRGSVIPLFKDQILRGGPVTVTHPEMIRYFMTIPEASKLVIQAGALARGGEIFVLDMGEPVKIIDLAKNLIRLSGNSVEDIGIEFTGVRPGEKLFEELLKDDEILEKKVYPKIYIGKTANLYIDEIKDIISSYSTLSKEELRNLLVDLANNRVEEKTLVSLSI